MSTTLEMSLAEIEALRTRLESEGFEFRPLQYAHFQARRPGVVVSAYKSGKVVVQGKAAGELFELPSAPKLEDTVAGSDESGKGDYFGPLVVAAVVVTPEHEDELAAAGVRDCKKMSDSSILRVAKAIRDLCPCAVSRLDPAEYNRAHEAEGNVALFLSRMHAEALAGAIGRSDHCDRIVIDQFTFASRLEGALHDFGVDLPVEIRPKAEDNPAVAAASVLARAEFLLGLKELGHDWGVDLPKGASRQVEAVGRDIYRAGGREALDKVAKTHFKTTLRVTQQEF
ncbi:MAG: ribonuclease HIII [Planctomycetota bacterium]|jgi:ribonuclease HIII